MSNLLALFIQAIMIALFIRYQNYKGLLTSTGIMSGMSFGLLQTLLSVFFVPVGFSRIY